jgi:hypothetical protein
MVAAAVGIPATVLSAYERGRRQPGVEVAGRIIDALGYRVEFVRALDPVVQARRLAEVLTLAEALPFTPRPLARARRSSVVSRCENAAMSQVNNVQLGGEPLDGARLVEICEHYGVCELAVFGSVARGTQRRDSDVDVLFDLAPGARLGFGVSALQHELEELFGRPVDLLSKDSIHRLQTRCSARRKVMR